MSAVGQNWYSIASVDFPENRNPCSTSLMRIKKQQKMIRKVGKDLNWMQNFEQDKANPEIYRLVGTLSSLEDSQPCLPT